MRAPEFGRYGIDSRFPQDPPRIVLERDISGGTEQFILHPPIRYDAVLRGHQVQILVPPVDSDFRTDLTSVPSWFTWLVPKSGAHLPAALIHDGLVANDSGAPTYETIPPGVVIDRIDADRIFRDAMFDTDVGLLRCYLVWAAVSVASLWLGPRASWTTPVRLYYRAVIVLTLGLVLALGYSATVRLLDSSWPVLLPVPWMQPGGWLVEIGSGLAGAIVVPLVLGLLWGRYYPVAAIAGVALATLLHVTLAVGTVALAYQAAEMMVRWSRPVAVVIGALGWLAALAVFVTALVR